VVPGPGVAIGGVEARAQITGGQVQLEMTGVPDRGGRVAVSGSIGLAPPRPIDLGITLDAMVVTHQQLFEASISGQARVTGSLAAGPLVTGTLFVNEAEIRIPNSPLARAGFVPQGLRHVGDSPAVRQTRAQAGIDRVAADGQPPRPVRLDLTLDAPARVFVRGRGLDAELGGRLHLGGTTRDIIPSGSFTLIRGRVDLLGNRFVLTEGSASLVGTFVPFLRLVATTESGGVATSVVLEGEATAPEIRFTSVPELPEDEVLARLIFRRPLTELSPFQAAQLAMSVATLTGRTDGGFLGRTRTALGLDELDFVVDPDGGTAVRAGRYITENIYTDIVLNTEGRTEVWQAVQQIQHGLGRAAQPHALWGADDGAVHEDRMRDHRGDQQLVVGDIGAVRPSASAGVPRVRSALRGVRPAAANRPRSCGRVQPSDW
jgi:translocation and assembly module TamB